MRSIYSFAGNLATQMKGILLFAISVVAFLVTVLILMRVANYTEAMLFGRVSVYQTICRKNDATGKWRLSPLVDGFERMWFRVSFPNQLVISEFGPTRFKECAVMDAENWSCNDEGVFPAISLMQGERGIYCPVYDACLYSIPPVQYYLNRLFSPLDWKLKREGEVICQQRSDIFDNYSEQLKRKR